MVYEEKSHVGMFQCYFCGKDAGILLDRRLRDILPRQVGVVDMTPCNECEEFMKQGIILISISDDTTFEQMKEKIPNPYRTGSFVVVKESFLDALNEGDMKEFARKNRFMFITDSAWDKIGLPREEIKPA